MRSTVVPLAVILAVAVAACASGNNPFPYDGQPGASEFNPTAVGKSVQAVIAYLQPQPGDVIDLVSAEAIGSFEGATVKLWLSRPAPGNGVEHTIGYNLEPLEGARITAQSASPGPDNGVGIVAEMTAGAPGTFTVTNVRLRYRMNGGDVQTRDGIATLWTVCADTPAPPNCGPTPPG